MSNEAFITGSYEFIRVKAGQAIINGELIDVKEDFEIPKGSFSNGDNYVFLFASNKEFGKNWDYRVGTTTNEAFNELRILKVVKTSGVLTSVASENTDKGIIDTVDIKDGAITSAKLASGVGTGGSASDATTTTKGIIQLAGDLAGTAASPTIATGAVNSSKIADGTITDTDVASANKDGTAATPSMRTLGTGATQAAAGNDSRLSDSRAPSGSAGGSLTGTYPNPTIATDAVGSSEIAAGAVGSSELADSSVTSAKIADGEIVNADINASAGIVLSKLATDPLARANHTGTQTASTVSDFDTQVRTSRLDQMAAPTSSVSLNSQKITSLATPTASGDAATKSYVDGATYAGVSDGTVALAKLASGTSGQIIVANSSGVPTYVAMSGDATISNTGVITIGSNKVGTGPLDMQSYAAEDANYTSYAASATQRNMLQIASVVAGIYYVTFTGYVYQTGASGSVFANFYISTSGGTASWTSSVQPDTSSVRLPGDTNTALYGKPFSISGTLTVTATTTVIGYMNFPTTQSNQAGGRQWQLTLFGFKT